MNQLNIVRDKNNEIQKLKDLRGYVYRHETQIAETLGTPVMLLYGEDATKRCAQTHLTITIAEKKGGRLSNE